MQRFVFFEEIENLVKKWKSKSGKLDKKLIFERTKMENFDENHFGKQNVFKKYNNQKSLKN